jgi:NAD(P)H-hydrate epimerase
MKNFEESELKNLYLPSENSHKGQNGKLLVIGGSELFHAASLWALSIASKIVDMVFYASVPTNNQIVMEAKKEFRNGIVIPRENIEDYIKESDCILIGPGMVRSESTKLQLKSQSLKEIGAIKDEGEQTYFLTKYILEKYPKKKYVIDAGALQMMDKKWLLDIGTTTILTPHPKEFERLFDLESEPDHVSQMAGLYKTTILLKGHVDIVCTEEECVVVKGGNAGMSKGGTGDVLAGLTAALFCKNDAKLSAKAASFFNKKAGESLFERVGYYFNSSDLVEEIPKVMKKFLIS